MNARRYQLRPWLIRTLLPPTTIGAYVLWESDRPVYAGRSDTSLRRRLLEHAGRRSAEYFSYDAASSVSAAFDMECSLFHALGSGLRNSIHPQRPYDRHHDCAFCASSVAHARLWAHPDVPPAETGVTIHGPV
ncbi:hypothetical protein ABFT23_02000 [Nocardioides sp. C4-1]|uniref:hypothetical protein n=1 Tax=Nocardioides sp. C4-1 TaxID=3151851 RepID=UPI0032633192